MCVFVLVFFFALWGKYTNPFFTPKPRIDLFLVCVGRSFLSGINIRTGLCGLKPLANVDHQLDGLPTRMEGGVCLHECILL